MCSASLVGATRCSTSSLHWSKEEMLSTKSAGSLYSSQTGTTRLRGPDSRDGSHLTGSPSYKGVRRKRCGVCAHAQAPHLVVVGSLEMPSQHHFPDHEFVATEVDFKKMGNTYVTTIHIFVAMDRHHPPAIECLE